MDRINPLPAGAITAKGASMDRRRDRSPLEELFCSLLPFIESLARSAARRSGFPVDEHPDIVGCVRLRMIEGDYSILAKYRGESSIESYLAIVVTRLVRDYRFREWGRWRPSAFAVRNGSLAVRLETLTRRDGLPFEHALHVIRSEGWDASERSLRQLHRLLPAREPLRPGQVDVHDPEILASLASRDGASDAAAILLADDRQRILDAVERELRELPPEEQLIIRLRFREGLAIADVARALGLAEKPLYRRLPEIVGRLRRRLEAAGVAGDDLHDVLDYD
jgi:RNA polymerase sigma factor (sigma-70 family)